MELLTASPKAYISLNNDPDAAEPAFDIVARIGMLPSPATGLPVDDNLEATDPINVRQSDPQTPLIMVDFEHTIFTMSGPLVRIPH